MIARFGHFEADAARFELRRDGEVIPVQRRVLETILFLAQSGGRLVTRRDLIAGPWQGTFVGDAAIGQAIMHARRALEDPARPHDYIVTVRGKGFRWSERVELGDRHDPFAGTAPGPPLGGHAPIRIPIGSPARELFVDELRTARHSLEVTRRHGDRLRQLDALLCCAELASALGDKADFDRLAGEHRQLAHGVRHPGHRWLATLIAGTAVFRSGYPRRAAWVLARNLETGRRVLGPAADGMVASHVLNLALELTGDRLRAALARAVGLATRARHALAEPGRRVAAVARLHLGDRAGARQVLQAIEVSALPAGRQLLPALVNLIDLAIAFRDGARLEGIYRRLAPHLGLWVSSHFADWGPVTYHLGRAARALGLRAESRRLAQLSLTETRRSGSRPWALWAAHAWAQALLDGGNRADRRRAGRLLERTLSSAGSLGLPALTRAGRATLASMPHRQAP